MSEIYVGTYANQLFVSNFSVIYIYIYYAVIFLHRDFARVFIHCVEYNIFKHNNFKTYNIFKFQVTQSMIPETIPTNIWPQLICKITIQICHSGTI